MFDLPNLLLIAGVALVGWSAWREFSQNGRRPEWLDEFEAWKEANGGGMDDGGGGLPEPGPTPEDAQAARMAAISSAERFRAWAKDEGYSRSYDLAGQAIAALYDVEEGGNRVE